MKSKTSVLIVGGGIMGCLTAYELGKRGLKVRLIEQSGILDSRGASNDRSKGFRVHYGQNHEYTRLALQALRGWMKYEKVFGEQFYHPTGKLLLGRRGDAYAAEAYELLRDADLPVELFNRRQLAARFPQFDADYAVLDKLGGLLDAGRFLPVLYDRLSAMENVDLLENQRVRCVSKEGVEVEGAVYTAEQVLVTAGAWTYKLLDIPVQATRQNVLYFKPKNEQLFRKDRFPVFSLMEKGY